MEDSTSLKAAVKELLVESLMLRVSASEIADESPLFGPGGLGLDSVDALQLVVALDKRYGLKIPDPGTAQQVLRNVTTIAAAVQEVLASRTPPAS